MNQVFRVSYWFKFYAMFSSVSKEGGSCLLERNWPWGQKDHVPLLSPWCPGLRKKGGSSDCKRRLDEEQSRVCVTAPPGPRHRANRKGNSLSDHILSHSAQERAGSPEAQTVSLQTVFHWRLSQRVSGIQASTGEQQSSDLASGE